MTQYWIVKHFTIPVEINGVINPKAMLNTGAMANFIHQDIVKKHGIQTTPWQNPLTTKDIHGRILAIVDEQAIFHLCIRLHIKTIVMDIMPTSQHSLILGMPWMEVHNPWIRIAEKDLMFMSQYCQEHCLNIDPHVVTKPTPYSDSTHFSDHFGYHITFPLLSHDGQAHVRLIEQPPRSCAHDQELAHVTVSLLTWQSVSLVNYLLPYLQHTPTFSIVNQHYL